MQYRNLGSSDLKASVVGMGAWAIGGGASWGSKVDDEEAIRTIETAVDSGINFFDTAPAYGWGHSERLLGRAIQGRRDQVILATKCGLWWDDDRGSFFADFEGRPLYRSLRPDTLAIEIERSLQNLNTEYIDLYQVHWPAVEPEQTPIADTMEALLKLVEAGKVRAIGVCNVSEEELQQYLACGAIVSDQFRYSMLYRSPEKDILPRCQQQGLATLTYMSLEQGLLTGKVTAETVFEQGDLRTHAGWNPWYLLANRTRVIDLLQAWKPLCDEYNCNLAQLVLGWTLAQDAVTHVLAGARRPDQIRQNAAAGDLSLSAEIIERMNQDLTDLGEPNPDP
ncbi:aldo/keto reductase [Novipirellula artificiosorum]|uniref:General stress protein 69 n=1 Tax=Novipirellula artificiosorum TaxID=2528016 RepID=A0A5C6DC43_9BACT|nr:aldo/keto reductase [Novipirellula artificiosorum]TWU33281.1 General stress protein 69 [Novipirellula artificiosorum]